ncbi:MAG TPA: hypothetical protein PKA37_01090 [Planctomycetota bacterium]|jgi:hypothetical protein|nr:hypothetical protein [Planctomycetota bacterium]
MTINLISTRDSVEVSSEPYSFNGTAESGVPPVHHFSTSRK